MGWFSWERCSNPLSQLVANKQNRKWNSTHQGPLITNWYVKVWTYKLNCLLQYCAANNRMKKSRTLVTPTCEKQNLPSAHYKSSCKPITTPQKKIDPLCSWAKCSYPKKQEVIGKFVRVINEAPRREDVLGCGGIAPRINLGTRWRWVLNFTPRPLYPAVKTPVIH
jgi:hypothetical protein